MLPKPTNLPHETLIPEDEELMYAEDITSDGSGGEMPFSSSVFPALSSHSYY